MLYNLLLSVALTTTFPHQLHRALAYEGLDTKRGSRAFGYAVPINGQMALTAAHLTQSGRAVLRTHNGDAYEVELVRGDAKRDLALMRTVLVEILPREPGDEPRSFRAEFPNRVAFAKKRPRPGDLVFYRGWLPSAEPAFVQGRVLGYDSEGDMHIDGWGHPGSSGSPILNEKGELVAILVGAANWSAPGKLEGTTAEEAFQRVIRRTFFRSTAYGAVVVGGWPK